MFNRILKTVIKVIIYFCIGAIFFIPFYWMSLTAIKNIADVLNFPPGFWVISPQWQNFKTAFTSIPFLHYTLNSLIVTAGILVCQFFTVIPAAYAFARYRFRGRDFFFALTPATMMIPGQLVFLPIFLLFSKWNMINSYWSLILPFASSAIGIFMLRQSFMKVPEELIEAARLDKANEFKIIYRVLLPIARPTVVTLALFTFIFSWNDYFWPLVMTTTDTVRTLPMGIVTLKTVDIGITQHIVMAGNVMMLLPIGIVFVFAHKQIIKAFTYTGEK